MHFLCLSYIFFVYLQYILLVINMLKSKNREYKNRCQFAEKLAKNVIFC